MRLPVLPLLLLAAGCEFRTVAPAANAISAESTLTQDASVAAPSVGSPQWRCYRQQTISEYRCTIERDSCERFARKSAEDEDSRHDELCWDDNDLCDAIAGLELALCLASAPGSSLSDIARAECLAECTHQSSYLCRRDEARGIGVCTAGHKKCVDGCTSRHPWPKAPVESSSGGGDRDAGAH